MTSTKNAQEAAATVMALADNMASAAATFSSHGYDAFISARDELKAGLQDLVKEPLKFDKERRSMPNERRSMPNERRQLLRVVQNS